MSKQKSFHQAVTDRQAEPKVSTNSKGTYLMCPFCSPSHPLVPGGVAACGTFMQVKAIQPIYDGRRFKDYVCVKCGKGGGRLVHFNEAFIHTNDCMPGVATFVDPPKFSRMADLVYHAPAFLKRVMEKRLGEVKPVEEVTQDGTRTGKHLGYFFWKKAT